MKSPSQKLPLGPYIPGWAAASFFAALSSAAILFLPKVVQTAIDSFRAADAANLLVYAILMFFGLSAAAVLFKFFAGLTFAFIAKDLWEKLSVKCVQSALRSPDASPGAGLFTSVNQDTRAVMQFAENGLARVASSFWLYILGFVFLGTLSWKYIPAALAASFASFCAAFFWHNRIEKYYERERSQYETFVQALSISVGNLEWIKGRAREDTEGKKIAAQSRGHLSAALQASLFSIGLTPLILMIWAAAGLAFIIIGVLGYKNNVLTLGEFAASFLYLAFFSLPALDFSYAGDLFRRARVGWRNIGTWKDSPGALVPEEGNGFERKFSENGFFVFGKEVMDREEIRKICSERDGIFLEHTAHFFRRPLIENFLLMTQFPSLEEILEALERAGLIERDAELPGAWLDRDPDTFSSGERKRAALARLFLMQASKIWMLEDPVAGLNRELSDRVLESLRRFSENRVVVIFTDDPRVHQTAESYAKSDLEA